MGKNIKYTFETKLISGEWHSWYAYTLDVDITLGEYPDYMVAYWCEKYGLAEKYPLVREALEAYKNAEKMVAMLEADENVSTEALHFAYDLPTYTYDVLCRVVAELDNEDMVAMLALSMGDAINSLRLVSREAD